MKLSRHAAALLALVFSNGLVHAQSQDTTTPIKHVVVIFDENQSFDHYFGTYPNAANPQDEPPFLAAAGTPEVNGLTGVIQNHNPNTIAPFRLDRSQNVTCDNDNAYTDEQKAFDGGLLDKFATITSSPVSAACPIVGLSMGYYDGNTVTALWNYAQHFAMSDNFFDTEFGTTVMGHLNLISGSTHQTTLTTIPGKVANGSVIANVEPPAANDDCTSGTAGSHDRQERRGPAQRQGRHLGLVLRRLDSHQQQERPCGLFQPLQFALRPV